MSFRRWLNRLSSILVAGALASCATPLENLVKQDAPGYRVKGPAIGDAELGRRLIGDQPETNMCFVGDTTASTYQSWSNRALEYDGSADADLRADFGETLKAEAGASRKSAFELRLESVTQMQLNSLFFNAQGPCASDNRNAGYLTGKTEEVITRALKAATISIGKNASGSTSVSVNTERVAGSVSGESSTAQTWAGTNLFFADYPEKVRVTRTDLPRQLITVNQTVDLGNCGFTLRAIQDQWQGTLSCQGGSRTEFKAPLGDYAATEVAPGVSYSIRVIGAGVARGQIDMHRYNVVSSQ